MSKIFSNFALTAYEQNKRAATKRLKVTGSVRGKYYSESSDDSFFAFGRLSQRAFFPLIS